MTATFPFLGVHLAENLTRETAVESVPSDKIIPRLRLLSLYPLDASVFSEQSDVVFLTSLGSAILVDWI